VAAENLVATLEASIAAGGLNQTELAALQEQLAAAKE
jgi:hypothetical protein